MDPCTQGGFGFDVRKERGERGERGERAVAEWYLRAGYEVLAANWRCREGEIDVVLRGPGERVVFCEVKSRTSDRFGTTFEAVTPAKQRRLRRLASMWLSEQRSLNRGRLTKPSEVRFDVAGVRFGPGGRCEIEVLEDAF